MWLLKYYREEPMKLLDQFETMRAMPIIEINLKDYGVANVDIHSQTNNYNDPYKDKYIQLLEAEVARLKKLEEK